MTRFREWLASLNQERQRLILHELATQLAMARQFDRLEHLLLTFDYLHAKLRATGVAALARDFRLAEEQRDAASQVLSAPINGSVDLRTVERTLQLCGEVLSHSPEALGGEVLNRIAEAQSSGLQTLLRDARSSLCDGWLEARNRQLDTARSPLISSLAGGSGEVQALAVTPDGRHAATMTSPGAYGIRPPPGSVLKAFDLRAAIATQTLEVEAKDLLALSPTGRVAFVAQGPFAGRKSGDGEYMYVWDLETGDLLRREEVAVVSACQSDDNRYALFGLNDGSLSLWDAEHGLPLWRYPGHAAPIGRVAMSLDGRLAISCCARGMLRLWDLRGTQSSRVLDEGARFPALATDGQLVAWTRGDKLIVHTVKECDVAELSAQSMAPLIICARNTRVLGVVGPVDDMGLRLYDIERMTEVELPKVHTGTIRSLAAHPTEPIAVSASGDKTIVAWNVDVGRPLVTWRGHAGGVNDVRIPTTGHIAVSGSTDGTIRVWDLKSATESSESLADIERTYGAVYDAVCVPDGSHVLSVTSDNSGGCLILWNLSTGRLAKLYNLMHECRALAIAADAQRAFVGQLGHVDVWNLTDYECEPRLSGQVNHVRALASSRDGAFLVAGGIDGTLGAWQGSQFRTYSAAPGHQRDTSNVDRFVNCVAILSVPHRFVSGSADGAVRVWHFDRADPVYTLAGHHRGVRAIAVRGDDHLLAGAGDGTVTLWSLARRQEIWRLKAHAGPIRQIKLTADERRFVTCSDDRTLRVWDLATRKQSAIFGADSAVLSCCVHESGSVFFAGELSGKAHVLTTHGPTESGCTPQK